jgi:hypothetical protein
MINKGRVLLKKIKQGFYHFCLFLTKGINPGKKNQKGLPQACFIFFSSSSQGGLLKGFLPALD